MYLKKLNNKSYENIVIRNIKGSKTIEKNNVSKIQKKNVKI